MYVYSTALKNTLLNYLASRFPAGSILELRTGTAPAANAAATGTVVATVVLPASPWATSTAASLLRQGVWQDLSADATGDLTNGHFRMRVSSDANGSDTAAERWQGTITATGNGGDMTVDNPNVTAGQQITLTGFTANM